MRQYSFLRMIFFLLRGESERVRGEMLFNEYILRASSFTAEDEKVELPFDLPDQLPSYASPVHTTCSKTCFAHRSVKIAARCVEIDRGAETRGFTLTNPM